MHSTRGSDKREGKKRTVATMIKIYCRGNKHSRVGILCPSCDEILQYSIQRIDHCPVMEAKSFCSSCAVHCYKEEMRTRIRTVMRYSGPRMMLYHPIMALHHLGQKRTRSRRDGTG